MEIEIFSLPYKINWNLPTSQQIIQRNYLKKPIYRSKWTFSFFSAAVPRLPNPTPRPPDLTPIDCRRNWSARTCRPPTSGPAAGWRSSSGTGRCCCTSSRRWTWTYCANELLTFSLRTAVGRWGTRNTWGISLSTPSTLKKNIWRDLEWFLKREEEW